MIFLRNQNGHTNSPRPDMILLDLNRPKMGGLEVLGHIKKDPDLQAIPVVIPKTSERQADVTKCYELKANCYLNKPVQSDGFSTIIASLNRFLGAGDYGQAADAEDLTPIAASAATKAYFPPGDFRPTN